MSTAGAYALLPTLEPSVHCKGSVGIGKVSDGFRAVVPNDVTPEHFRALRLYWDDGQIVEMLAVVGLFDFLNRWNETMATQIEGEPRAIAQDRFGNNWDPGKHVG